MTKAKASRTRVAVRKSAAGPPSAPGVYDLIKTTLERDHHGSYVMINAETSEYVVAPTTSQVHSKFIEKFGNDAPGWCTRIGTSVFATA